MDHVYGLLETAQVTMGDTLFRELFVELPEAILDALKSNVKTQLEHEDLHVRAFRGARNQMVAQALCERYGWTTIVSDYGMRDGMLRISGKLYCGHTQTIHITDHQLESASRHEVIGVLDRAVSKAGRRCYCVLDLR